MKRVLFINTHAGSNAHYLMAALSKNKHIQRFKGFAPFNHPDDLKKLTDKRHKCDNSAAIYMHELYNNTHWVRKPVRKVSQFIHLIREPRATLSEVYQWRHEVSNQDILNAYCYRLRGIYEMVKRTPNSLVFDESNIDKKAIEEMLDIDPIDWEPKTGLDVFPEELCKIAEEAYERYFKLLDL